MKPEVLLLSEERLKSYKNIEDYILNIVYSSEYYVKLHLVEVSLRNRLNNILINEYGSGWLTKLGVIAKIFDKNTVEIITKQIKSLSSNKAKSQGSIVAHLSFGIWILILLDQKSKISKKKFTKLFNLNNVQLNKHLNKLCTELLTIKNFRNRIFHYEKVHEHHKFKNIKDLIDRFIHLLDEQDLLISIIEKTKNYTIIEQELFEVHHEEKWNIR